MNILQIAGGQTWPNFLPLLGYRPKHVYFLTSRDSKGDYAKMIEALKKAAAELPVPLLLKVDIISTVGENPTLQECQDILATLDPSAISLINLTGGTKAMSLAAYLFAEKHGIPSFHLDTRRTDLPFDDYGTAPHTTPFPKLSELSQQIDVRTALICQGFPAPQNFKKASASDLAFAKAAAKIGSDQKAFLEISAALTSWRKELHGENGTKFLTKGKLRDALQRVICAPLETAWGQYLHAAAQHGHIVALDPPDNFVLTSLDPISANTDELRSQAQSRFKFLEGLWFELAVLDHLSAKPEFSDVQWSVEADPESTPTASSKGETDLVAFNHQTLNLHFISCKTRGPHSTTLDHIQGLRARATKEGGQYSIAELWIFRPKNEVHQAELERHCKEQKVKLNIFTQLVS